MFKLLRWCSVLTILSAGSLLATNHPCPGNWGVSVDFLYLKPSVDDTYFVIQSPTTSTAPNGTRKNNDFHFHPGFRIGGVYEFCECNQELQVYYTRLSCKQSKTLSGSFFWPTAGHPFRTGDGIDPFNDYTGTASSSVQTLYQRVDANFAQQTLCCCGLDVYLQLGLEYAYLHLNETDTYAITDNVTSNVYQKSRAWGIGPQLGTSIEYQLCECEDYLPGKLSFTGLASGSLLASQSNGSTRQTVGVASSLSVSDPNTWRIIPALHARVGLNYATTISCYDANLEIGYEFNTYLKGLGRAVFLDSTALGSSTSQYRDYDVQGLYISAAMQF